MLMFFLSNYKLLLKGGSILALVIGLWYFKNLIESKAILEESVKHLELSLKEKEKDIVNERKKVEIIENIVNQQDDQIRNLQQSINSIVDGIQSKSIDDPVDPSIKEFLDKMK